MRWVCSSCEATAFMPSLTTGPSMTRVASDTARFLAPSEAAAATVVPAAARPAAFAVSAMTSRRMCLRCVSFGTSCSDAAGSAAGAAFSLPPGLHRHLWRPGQPRRWQPYQPEAACLLLSGLLLSPSAPVLPRRASASLAAAASRRACSRRSRLRASCCSWASFPVQPGAGGPAWLLLPVPYRRRLLLYLPFPGFQDFIA